MNDLIERTTNTRHRIAIANCDKTAADILRSPIFEISLPAVMMNPISPIKTATCMRCLRNCSRIRENTPSSSRAIPTQRDQGSRAGVSGGHSVNVSDHADQDQQNPKAIEVEGWIS